MSRHVMQPYIFWLP